MQIAEEIILNIPYMGSTLTLKSLALGSEWSRARGAVRPGLGARPGLGCLTRALRPGLGAQTQAVSPGLSDPGFQIRAVRPGLGCQTQAERSGPG